MINVDDDQLFESKQNTVACVAGKETSLFTTAQRWTAISVFVDLAGDAGYLNATFRVYALTLGSRAKIAEVAAAVVAPGTQQLVQVFGVGNFEVTVQPAAQPSALLNAAFVANGTEPASVGPTGPAGANGADGADGATGATGAAGANAGLPPVTFAARPAATGKAGVQCFVTDGGYSCVSDGVSWHPLIQGIYCTQPPLASGFSAPFGSPVSLVDSNGSVILKGATGTTASGYVVTGSAGLSIEALCTNVPQGDGTGTSGTGGIELRESATGKHMRLILGEFFNTGSTPVLYLQSSDDVSFTVTQFMATDFNGPIFMRVEIDGANIVTKVSRNRNWASAQVIDTQAVLAVFTVGPDEAAIVVAGGILSDFPVYEYAHLAVDS